MVLSVNASLLTDGNKYKMDTHIRFLMKREKL